MSTRARGATRAAGAALAALALLGCDGMTLTDGAESREELAREVTELTVGQDSATAALERLLSETDAPIEPRLEAVLREELEAGIETLQAQLSAIYAREFTAEELRAIRDFYKSPAGQSLRTRLGAIAPETQRISQAWAGAALERARDRYAREAEAAAR